MAKLHHLLCTKEPKMSPPDATFELEIRRNAFAAGESKGREGKEGGGRKEKRGGEANPLAKVWLRLDDYR